MGRRKVRDIEGQGAAIGARLDAADLHFALVVMTGPVFRAALERPHLHRAIRIPHRFAEGQGDGTLRRGDRQWHLRGSLAAADAMEAAGCGRVAGPGEHAAGVECTVGTEAAAHDAGVEGGHRQFAHRALPLAADFLVRHDEHAAGAVAEVEQAAAEIAPGVLRHPDEFRRAAVLGVGHPDHRRLHRGVGGVGDRSVAEHVAVEAAGLHAVDAVLRRPEAFLVGDEEGAVVIDAHAVRGAEAGGEDLGLRPVGTHLQQRAVLRHHAVERVAAGLGVVEIAGRVGLQAHRELVEVLGDLGVVVEALDEVGLAVSVEILQAGDLVAAGDEQFIAAELHAEGLEQAAGDAPPGELGRSLVHGTLHAPDIAVPHRDDCSLAIGREIEATRAQPALPGIVERQGEVVGDERSAFIACHGGGGDGLRPLRRATAGQRREVERRSFGLRQAFEGGCIGP